MTPPKPVCYWLEDGTKVLFPIGPIDGTGITKTSRKVVLMKVTDEMVEAAIVAAYNCRPLRVVLLHLPFGLCLTACASAPPAPPTKLEAPASLLSCRPEPAPPAKIKTDAQLADYMIAVADAGEDCRRKLAAVKEIVER